MDRIEISTTDDGYSGSSYPCLISSVSGSGERVVVYQRQVWWSADVLLLIKRKMDTFTDDIFGVFDESAEERVPTEKEDEKQSIQILKFQPDVK